MEVLILIGILTISSASPRFRSEWESAGYGIPGPDPDLNFNPSASKVQVTSAPRIEFPWISSNNINRGKAKKASKNGWNDYAISKCMEECPKQDYNPVCGTDRNTYSTPDKLQCAQRCGLNVNILWYGSCSITGIGTSIQICIATCSGTPGLGPVCGTDGITYPSKQALDCVKNCGRDVEVFKLGPCLTSTLTPPPILKPTPTPTPTPTSTPHKSTTQECINNCSPSFDFKPVCGTDGVTYINIESLQCKINCGVDINKLSDGLCSPPPTKTEPPPISTTKRPPINECISKCSVSLVFSPVCGTDGTTYPNIESLLCKISCGVDINKLSDGPCSPPPTKTESPPLSTTKRPPTEECISKCSVSLGFSPVCGTDGTTYPNIESLLCKISCGVDINKLSDGPCSPPPTKTELPPMSPTSVPTSTTKQPTTEECIKKCVISFQFSPVCGTDGVTYINFEFLQCNIKCGVAVNMLTPGTCSSTPTLMVPPPTSTSTSTTTTTTTTTPTPTESSAITHSPCEETSTNPGSESNCKPTLPITPQTESGLEACINKCTTSLTLIYKPTCGTDGLTYINIQTLQCAKQCGKNVDVKNQSGCFSGSRNDNTSGNHPS